MTYNKRKTWKQVNLTHEAKDKLDAICEALSNEYAKVSLTNLLDKLITDKFNEVFTDKK